MVAPLAAPLLLFLVASVLSWKAADAAAAATNIQQIMQQFWSSPSEIIANLNDYYEILWIQPHGCVWRRMSH
jgi:hypothetical protein